jgi:hypothetical protein
MIWVRLRSAVLALEFRDDALQQDAADIGVLVLPASMAWIAASSVLAGVSVRLAGAEADGVAPRLSARALYP